MPTRADSPTLAPVLRRAALALVLAACSACPGADAPEPAVPEPAPVTPSPSLASSALVGSPAREFTDLVWLDEQPRTLASLRGQVVLVRFWTDTCPYCRGTAPKLRQLDAEFRAQGLTVLGLYHAKPRGRAAVRDEVVAAVKEWALEFPVALDSTWSTIDAWWLTTGDREATSSSFLIDRRGVIRLVHPGPEFSDAELAELRAKISALLAEPS